MTTHQDMRDQIVTATDASDGIYDVDAIAEAIVDRYGVVDVDTIDSGEFWRIVGAHGTVHTEMANPPDIDPHAHQVELHARGEEVYILVAYDGAHYAWIASPMGGTQVYPMGSEQTARAYLARQRVSSMLAAIEPADEGRTIRYVRALDPATRITREEVAVLDGADDGLWLVAASYDDAGHLQEYELEEYDDRDAAEAAWSDLVDERADRLDDGETRYGDILADVLRYRAAVGRADTFRSRAGDKIRVAENVIKGDRQVSALAEALGVSREYLYRVMAADEWT